MISEQQPKALTEEKAVEKVVGIMKHIMEEIPHHKVYFTMREMKLRRISEATTDYMKACLAIHSCGFPITTFWVQKILGKDRASLAQTLHGLGDKNCLTMKRKVQSGRGGAYEWVINPVFLKYYNGEQ